ncbi:MAG: radical SAM protein [Rhodospirillales bacterium]
MSFIIKTAKKIAGLVSAKGNAKPASYLLVDKEQDKIDTARRLLSNGVLPSNFSIGLGAAPCNHSCLFCPQSVEKPKKADWLDLALLEKVLHEMPEKGISLGLSSYSETLAAPNLIPAVRLIKKIRPGLPVIMATNGSLFRPKVIEELIDLGLDWYSYSFDAASRDDYAALMQKDDFQIVWDNLEELLAMRAAKSSSMKITSHIMAFKGREKDFEKFTEYWGPKLDGINFRPVANWGSSEIGLKENLARAGFEGIHEAPEKRYPCMSIFQHFKLQFNGKYYPCVAAIPAYHTEMIDPLGHASEMTWGEAWAQLGTMRRAHLEGRWDEFASCRNCNVWGVSYSNVWDEETASDGHTRFKIDGVEYSQ